jgi:hypothetical protein
MTEKMIFTKSEIASFTLLSITSILLVIFLFDPNLIDRPLYQGITGGQVIDVVETSEKSTHSSERIIIVTLDSGGVYSAASNYKKKGDRVHFATYKRLFSRQITHQIFLKDE